MRTTDGMSAPGYADLVRRIVEWAQEQQDCGLALSYRAIARRYRLTLDEVEDVVGDSEVYGPQIMPHACRGPRGSTTAEVLAP